ncbi:hypothetical protein F2Q70_00004023 [Brassica cretica]|uniref:Uncharacterized protein n=1 Tax=Brassica cretica TaxID=69181 RepID=A0A8S9J2C5_BRACR|nr:hypothetical protein F2Q70_00004023 [Brassica cretica]
MGDRDQEKTWRTLKRFRSPRDTSLGLANHNQTASLDTGQLCGWFESHHGLGGWAKRLSTSQKARVAKGHELSKVVVSDPYGSDYDLLSQDRLDLYQGVWIDVGHKRDDSPPDTPRLLVWI